MKNLVVCLLIISSVGCGAFAESTTNAASERGNLTDDDANRIILHTMQQIKADLIKLKTEFPQLSAIDSAGVSSNRFQYSTGWESHSKTKGVVFNKDGGDIAVWTKYPAKSGDIEQLEGSPFMRIGNGKYLMWWMLVRAEKTDQANRFRAKVEKIISINISKMLDSLGYKPNDYTLRLPDK
jgi:hypothetical protein